MKINLNPKSNGKGVASFAEAWIEKYKDKLKEVRKVESPPSRRRGLKKKLMDN